MEVKSICIVGGGSSGWMMATALSKYLEEVSITIIESPNIKTIGVGESTIPYTTRFINDYLGFKEEEWMPFCNATYKCAIRFNNFRKDRETIYHPFWEGEESSVEGYTWAVKNQLNHSDIKDYYSSHYITYHMAEHAKFSKEGGINYAHHIDADKFGEFCKNKLLTNSRVSYIQDTIVDILSEEGSISKLITKEGSIIDSDIYIDCTGFSALLIGKTCREPFESIKDTLLNDRAVVCRVPYTKDSKEEELEPYTDCTALSSGWAWNTPLWNRIGAGYVYSSKFLGEQEANKEFQEYLENKFGKDRITSLDFRTIKFEAGHYKNAWAKNCVSLVLASGFIEPLESTGLALAAFQIKAFIKLLKDSNCNTTALSRSIYNNKCKKAFEEIHEFVFLHYCATDRQDSPYWKFISEKQVIPPNILNRILNNTEGPPTFSWFPEKSWECILLGFKVPGRYTEGLTYAGTLIEQLSEEEQFSVLKNIENFLRGREGNYLTRLEDMSSHYTYLKRKLYDSSD